MSRASSRPELVELMLKAKLDDPDGSLNLQGKSKKVRVIGSVKKIAGTKGKK